VTRLPDDGRFTRGLIHDLTKVLKAHGYDDAAAHYADVLIAAGDLCNAIEGRGDAADRRAAATPGS
jgi:hypothetical protein